MLDPIVEKDNIRKGVCAAVGCGKKCKGKFCGTCRSRMSRIADPVRYAYNNVKGRATRSGIFFDIELEWFRKFCVKTEYHLKKGRTIGSFDLDRKIEGKLPGYTKSNIRILDKVKNIKKYFRFWLNKTEIEKEKGNDETEDFDYVDPDCPF